MILKGLQRAIPAVAMFIAAKVSVHAREPLAGLDDDAAQAMKQWQVPGLAIAVVKDGKIVFARGFGVLKVGEPERVTVDTYFPLASCTSWYEDSADLGTFRRQQETSLKN